MDFVKKLLFLFCVVLYAAYCSTGESCHCDSYDNYDIEEEPCLVQYLKEKGKLNRTFRSTVRAMPRNCESIIKDYVESTKDNLQRRADYDFSNSSCLTNGFNEKEAVDHVIKIGVIQRKKLLTGSVKFTMLQESNAAFKNVLKELAVQCIENEDRLIFKVYGITFEKIRRLKDYDRDYCYAKHVTDNKLAELYNTTIYPHGIDPQGVNCDVIVGPLQDDTMSSIRKTLWYEAQERGREMDCALNVTLTNRQLGSIIVELLLENSDEFTEEIEVEYDKNKEKGRQILNSIISECFGSPNVQ